MTDNARSAAVFIDADNVSPSLEESVFEIADKIGAPIDRCAYGKGGCFSDGGGWQAAVTAGKACRRELVLTQTADLRGKRLQGLDLGALKTILKNVYHEPVPGAQPVLSALMSQRVIKADKAGKIILS